MTPSPAPAAHPWPGQGPPLTFPYASQRLPVAPTIKSNNAKDAAAASDAPLLQAPTRVR